MTDVLHTQATEFPSTISAVKGNAFINDDKLMASKHPISQRVIDIRGSQQQTELMKEIVNGLTTPPGEEKRIPLLLLWDEVGLKLFEEITYLDEYYLTNAEIEILQKFSTEMALQIPDRSMIIELGSGNLRKVDLLLRCLDKLEKKIDYFALDLDRRELERTLNAVQRIPYKHVKCYGLWGTYDDGISWLKQPGAVDQPRTILSLGSSIGNLSRLAAVDFLRGFMDVLGPQDKFLVGIDSTQDATKVYSAYNDSKGTTHKFVLNGLKHANQIMGEEAFDLSVWDAVGEYIAEEKRHLAFVTPKQNVTVAGVAIPAGERIRIGQSHKYGQKERARLWQCAGVQENDLWTDDKGDYAMILISKKA